MTFAKEERQRLAELLTEVGPDVPTLCEGWTTRDLVTHLCLRERHFPALAAEFLPGWVPAVGAYRRWIVGKYQKMTYSDLVAKFAGGAPVWSPFKYLDRFANTAELFIHYEDVRRAQGPVADIGAPDAHEWYPRVFDWQTNSALWLALKIAGRLLVSPKSVPVTVQWRGRNGIRATFNPGRSKQEPVRIEGHPGEMLLWVFGRGAHTVLKVDGDLQAVALKSI